MRPPDLPRLPDPQRSFAVLIGTSHYSSTELPDLPAVRNNLNALARLLTHPMLGGLPTQRCVVLPDPSDARTVYRALRQYAAAAEDTLLVYFAGHGRTGPRNELYLGLATTDPDELPVSALPFELVREVFRDSPADNRVVILDCCFSGRAIQDMSGLDASILGQLGIAGTYTLTSAPANAVALAPAGAAYTAFTGELLQLIHTGVPGGPELLTLNDIYRRLRHTMRQRGFPLPEQRTVGMSDQLALTRNPAHHLPPPTQQRPTPDVTNPPAGFRATADGPPRPATPHPTIHRPVNAPPPARRGRVRWRITLTLLLVLGLCGGLLWGTSEALRWAVDTSRGGSPSKPSDSHLSTSAQPNPSIQASPSGAQPSPLIERLAQPAKATYEKTKLTITSVKSGNGRVVLNLTADNHGSDQPLHIWRCCNLVEQPSGRQRDRGAFDSGNFPGSPGQPIPANSTVTGDIIFPDASLDAATTALVVTLDLEYKDEIGPRTLQFNNVQLNPSG